MAADAAAAARRLHIQALQLDGVIRQFLQNDTPQRRAFLPGHQYAPGLLFGIMQGGEIAGEGVAHAHLNAETSGDFLQMCAHILAQ